MCLNALVVTHIACSLTIGGAKGPKDWKLGANPIKVKYLPSDNALFRFIHPSTQYYFSTQPISRLHTSKHLEIT